MISKEGLLLKPNELTKLIDYYCMQGAAEDQQILIMLLKEVQQLSGGILPEYALSLIAEKCHLKSVVIQALVRRIPALRTENAQHRLEICGSCAKSSAIAKFIEETYGVKSGEVSKHGSFFYQVTGCMKNCRQGPSVRWDGNLLSRVSTDTLRRLIETGVLPQA